MVSLKGLLVGLFAFVSIDTNAAEFLCPVPTNFQNLSCEGSVEVKSLTELIAYKNNLAQKKGRAKNVIIDFDVSTNALTISTPCKITISEKRILNINGDLCLHGGRGVKIDESIDLRASNVRLESDQEVIIEKHADLKAQNFELLSKGHTDDSKAHIRGEANVDVKNLLLDAYDRVSIGGSSTYHALESLKLFSRGDDDASVGAETKITATIFELQGYDKAKLGSNVNIKAESVIINSNSCSISNKTIVIDAQEKLGSCFLQSSPKGLFKADVNNGFAPLTVNFDAEKITSTSFIWSFGDAETETTTTSSASHVYSRPGAYTVTLRYLKEKKYKNAGSLQITVQEKPLVTPVASLNCSTNNLLVNCNALGSYDPQGQPLTFTFDYSDGFSESNSTGLSSHPYSTPGLYTVKLTIGNLAGQTAEATAEVQPMLPPNILPALVLNCAPPDNLKPNTLECDSIGSGDSDGAIVSYEYTFDDGTIISSADTNKISHSFLSGGSHLVSLKAVDNDGGVSTLAKSFAVKDNSNPIADFNCVSNKPYQVTCQSISSDVDMPNDALVEYSWGINNQVITSSTDSALSYNFHTAGNFSITLTAKDSYGGVGSITKTIAVKDNIAPLASFTCSNNGIQTIHCDSTSSDSDGQILSTAWVLDDGTNLSGTSFDHFFTTGGSHQVTLLATDDLGATSSSISNFLTISNQAPTVELFAGTTEGIAPLSINFEARNLADTDGTIASVDWIFSDGSTASGASVSHTFTTAGNFSVTLNVADNLGAVTTRSTTINVLEPLRAAPQAFFKIFQLDTMTELHATVTKTQFDIKRAFYTIDGTTTVEMTEFFPNTINLVDLLTFGPHKIDLTVEDVRGQTSTFSHTFNQTEDLSLMDPYSDFKAVQSSVRTVFLNFNKAFDFDRDENIISYHIEYGNGEAEDTVNLYATHTYPVAGTYQITVKAFSSHNTFSSMTHQVTVTDADVPILNPSANFGYRIYDYAENVSFYNDRSGTPNGSIISYLWDFGDGTSATGQRVAHFYNPGSYFVTLTVTDSAGLRDVQTQHVTIYQTGSDLIADVDCTLADPFVETIQQCKVTALDKLGQISKVSILWGDGSSAVNLNLAAAQGINKPTHKYSLAKTYLVTVNVFTTRGETKKVTANLILSNIPAPPVAAITCTSNNLTVTCNKDGTTDPSGGGIADSSYSFGDETPSVVTALDFAQHTYETPGTYKINLTVKSHSGLTSTVQTEVVVNYAPPTAQIGCVMDNMKIFCSSASIDPSGKGFESYIFDFGNNVSLPAAPGKNYVQYTYPVAGVYTVTLVVKNFDGLSSTTSTQVVASNGAPVANIYCYTNNMLVSCNGFGSYDPEQGSLSYEFSYADGFVEENLTGISTHAYTSPGLYSVVVKVTDDVGNSNFAITQVQALLPPNELPHPQLACTSTAPFILKCSAIGSTDSDGSIASYKYSWDDNKEDTTSSDSEFVHIFSSGGDHSVTLTTLDNDGGVASVTESFSVQINHPPVAYFYCSTNGPQKIQCNSLSSDPDAGDLITEYKWNLGDGKIVTTFIPSVEYTYSASSTYTVLLQVKDTMGATASFFTDVTPRENNAPFANIYCSVTVGTTYQCDSGAFDSDGQVVSQVWSINGSSLSGSSIVYNFTNGGDYPITLVMTDDLGKQSVANTIIHIDKPVADFNCSSIDTLKINCTISQSSNLENVIITKFIFDDRDLKMEKSVIYEFKNFGLHNVKLELTRNDGVIATLEKSFQFDSVYLSPKPSFASSVDLAYLVQFNASESLFQGRSISSYYWDFGDGNSDSSASWLTTHRYSGIGYFNVTLVVTDSAGHADQFSKKIYVYDPEVLDPGDANNDTVLGIDSDGDHIRDDIQRWINFEAADNIDLNLALKSLAKNWQDSIENTNDVTKSQSLFQVNQKMGIYVYGILDDDTRAANLIKVMKFLFFRTEERYQILLNIQSNNAGASLLGIPATKTERLNIMVGN